MSVKPVAWMHVSGGNVITDRNRDDLSDIGKRQYSIPLYSAPAPELAEALAELVEQAAQQNEAHGNNSLTPAIIKAKNLLARITPK